MLSFRNSSVGETAAPDLLGQCGGGRIYPPLADSPTDTLLKRPTRLRRTSPGASELGKSPSSLKNRGYAKLSLYAEGNRGVSERGGARKR